MSVAYIVYNNKKNGIENVTFGMVKEMNPTIDLSSLLTSGATRGDLEGLLSDKSLNDLFPNE